jgi:Zn-dependent protease
MPENWTKSTSSTDVTTLDIELLKQEIGRNFPFYDMKFNLKTAVFFIKVDEFTLEKNFESLRISLSKKGYIPMLRFESGEYLIYVVNKPKVKKKSIWINILLLIATIFTTTFAGSLQWVGIHNQAWIIDASFGDILYKSLTPSYLLEGLIYFSVPLLLILGIHEMGHYFISKRHKLDTSLPFFIPVPPPFILGTLGALIHTREPIPNRKALLDVGISGPICGFIIAIIVSIIGLFLMQTDPVYAISNGEELTVMYPLLLQGLSNFFAIPDNAIMHPTLFAGWVGFFITALNLLPIGQLDGGHIVKAILKDKQKYASWAMVIIIFALSFYYTGWLIFAFIILFLIGTSHQPPLNEYTPLDKKRKILGLIALIIFIVCFAPIPMSV